MVIGLVAIFIGTPLFAGEKSPDKIRISYPPGFVIGTLDFLKVLDPYLKEFNIRTESVPVRGGAENAVAVAAGQAEFSIGSVSPAINVALEKGPLKIIVTHAFEDADYRAGTVIVARKEIKSWKDLKGKIMGTHRLGSLSDITARVLLKANGLKPGEDVTIIELPFGGMAPALKRNQAQALAFFTPYAAEVYKEGYGWELGKTADVIPLLTRECWFGNSDFMAKNRGLSVRLTKAVLLATNEMAKISDEAYIKLIWDLWEGNKSILHDLPKYKMLHDRYIYDPSVLKESVATHVKLMEDYGVIKKTRAGFVDSIIDDSYWQQAYRELRGEKRLP
jgi:NitT/TauT family transport system substrate-binding protein